jgi:hypothetical protein
MKRISKEQTLVLLVALLIPAAGCYQPETAAALPAVPGKSDAPYEPCNGLDDNSNGMVDEGCTCARGSKQGCFSGPAAQRGSGICTDGVQICEGAGEFGSWGACSGSMGPAQEVCGDGVDQNCDGADTPCGPTPPPPKPTCKPRGQQCGTDSDCCDGNRCYQGVCEAQCMAAIVYCTWFAGKFPCKPNEYCHKVEEDPMFTKVYNGICRPGGKSVGQLCGGDPANPHGKCKRDLLCWEKHNKVGDPKVCVPCTHSGSPCPPGMKCRLPDTCDFCVFK